MKPNLNMRPNLSVTLKLGTVALLALALVARADTEDKITKSFKTPPGGQLVVQLDRGSIEVKTAATESVDVTITRIVDGTEEQAAKMLKEHVVSFGQKGGKVEVRSEYTEPRHNGWFSRQPNLRVECVVVVPRKFSVDLKTSGGSIGVTELAGNVQAHTSGGSMTFQKIDGPLTALTSGGNIKATGVKGVANVTTSGGSLNLGEIEGNVTAKTSGGSIRADNLTGKSVLKTSGGSIDAKAIKGQLDAHTSGGTVTAALLGQPSGDCSFSTSGGSVKLALDAKIAAEIDAHTSAGSVSSDFPVVAVLQGESKKNELRGKINGGGPLLKLTTSAGSIQIRKE